MLKLEEQQFLGEGSGVLSQVQHRDHANLSLPSLLESLNNENPHMSICQTCQNLIHSSSFSPLSPMDIIPQILLCLWKP